MFVRKSFVTNSSSTSFLAYGLIIPDAYLNNLFDDEDFDNLGNRREEILKGYPGLWISFSRLSDGGEVSLAIYVLESHSYTERDFNPIDPTDLSPKWNWDPTLTRWAEQYNLHSEKPTWFIANEVDHF